MRTDARSIDPHPALWWREEKGRVVCTLCPRTCALREGQSGFCFIRRNQGGELVSLGYGRPTGFGVDPVEKKPLNHFLPGTSILSFGTAGCNLGCKFCQNWTTTKAKADAVRTKRVTPEEVVRIAIDEGCGSIAYTYNDPVIFGEFVIDVSRLARAEGLKNVLVTAGYVTEEARADVFRFADAANVDLKAFTDAFYKKYSLARIEPVKETLLWIRRETSVWLEITTLLIPGLNDSQEEIRAECAWIRQNLGAGTPLHFTAFHPDYRMNHLPPTPHATLRRARSIAMEEGLQFVYVGNVLDAEGQTTSCPGCGAVLIERDWHSVRANRLREGACPDCGTRILGVWTS
ncbi:MAG: AmmeMemoRadiSam system radical SAM enzyme [Candidatus Eisenbacteria bacterium]